MTIHPTFTPAFFDPNSFNPISHSRRSAETKQILFSDKKYRAMTMQQFMAHPDFFKCQQEYAAILENIVGFIKGNADKVEPGLSKNTTDSIQDDFDTLKSHLFDFSEDFFSTHKPIVYGPGKEMFHELVNLLGNEKIALQKRMTAVIAMAPQMRVCSGGMLTVLQEALSSLKHGSAGIKGAAYRVKIQMMDALITKYVKKEHRYKPGNEVHFVNAHFNYMAKDMGVSERMDEFARIAESEISIRQFEKCKQTVLDKIKPGLLSKTMAENYLDQVKGAQQGDTSLPFEGEQLTDIFNRAKDIKQATLDSEFGDVPTENYLLQVPDTLSYQFARQPTLVARHFMAEMRNKQLVNYDDTIRMTEVEVNF